MQRILSHMRKAIEDYKMIEENDKIAICLSGGKDSITMLHAFKALQRFLEFLNMVLNVVHLFLNQLQRFYPKKFDIIAISINPGFEHFDTNLLQKMCDKLEIPLFIENSHAQEIVFDIRKERRTFFTVREV